MQALDALDLIKTGLIVYVEDFGGNSWPYGVKNVVNHELCMCQALGKKKVPIVTNELNQVVVVVPEENGAHHITVIIEETSDNNVKLTLRPTGEIDYIQRRRYFRLSRPEINIQYQLISEDGIEHPQMPVECIVWDISGGGAGIVIRSAKPIHMGLSIKLFLTLPEHEPIEIVGEVMRIVPRSVIRCESLIGIQFSAIREAHRDKIVQYITQELLSLRKKNKR